MSTHHKCECNCGGTDCPAPRRVVNLRDLQKPDFSEEAKSLRLSVRDKLAKIRKIITGMGQSDDTKT